MWLILAVISAVAAGFTGIAGKIGMKNVDTDVGVFFRTCVVLVFTFIMVLIVGSLGTIAQITWLEWIFIVSSGLATGLSWLCYFKALQLGNINKVVPVDKLSVVLTMTLAIIIFSEPFTLLIFAAMVIITSGTMLMVTKKEGVGETKSKKWLLYAIISLVFASASSVLAKAGMTNVDTNLGTFLRTAVVLLMALFIVLGKKKLPEIKKFSKTNWIFVILSGVLTGISWLCYFGAIQLGRLSVVAPIDKLSIVITVVFSFLIFKEKLNVKAIVGLCLLVGGTLLLLI